jgi:hypothetical protein
MLEVASFQSAQLFKLFYIFYSAFLESVHSVDSIPISILSRLMGDMILAEQQVGRAINTVKALEPEMISSLIRD